MRIEYRSPDATANPYLALSAIVLAGLDGVRNQLETPPPAPLPRSLGEALDALEADQEFLKRDGIFSEGLIKNWIELKRKEAAELALWPNPGEYQLYYEC
jgi:glutamine synthetase